METSTIDAAGQAASSGSKSRKSATEIFGDVLVKFLDRIGTAMDAPDDVEEAFFQSKPQAIERDTPPDRPDETPPSDRREASDKARDELPPLLAAAFVAVRDDAGERPAATAAEAASSDDKFHPDATAAPRSPSTTAEPGAAARVPTTPLAKDPTAAPVPVPPVPFAAGSNAANAPPPPVQVTVAPAAVQAQATAPLAAGSTLALQEQGADASKPAPSVGSANALAASAAANPGNGGGSGGANPEAGANGNPGQPGFGNLPAGIALPAAAVAQAAGSAATPAPFAAAIEQAAADGAEAALAPVLPANALASAEAAAGAKRAAALPPAPPLPRLAAMEQIAINVRKAVAAGLDEVTIQLRPDELGRIDVRMEVGKDGQVSAHIRADKPETLDLLQRDARGLERVLQDAGLRTDGNSLSFGLRGDNGAQGQGSGRPQQGVVAETAEETTAPLPVITRTADGRVDLHV